MSKEEQYHYQQQQQQQQQYQPPPQQYPPPGGAYYAPNQPPPGYPGQPQYSVVPQQPTVVVVSGPPVESFVCHFVLSCFTFWCCGWLFGLVAFILAVVAQSKSVHNPESARQIGKASLGVSIAGIIISVLVTVIFIVVYVLRAKQVVHNIHETIEAFCKYEIDGKCFGSRELSLTPNFCPRNGYFSDNYCYFKRQ